LLSVPKANSQEEVKFKQSPKSSYLENQGSPGRWPRRLFVRFHYPANYQASHSEVTCTFLSPQRSLLPAHEPRQLDWLPKSFCHSPNAENMPYTLDGQNTRSILSISVSGRELNTKLAHCVTTNQQTYFTTKRFLPWQLRKQHW
jgi:hypothetical protein